MKNTRLLFLIFCLTFVVFWIRGGIILDPDFGWHLRMGQLIITSGIPKTDPFSYTMSSFPFVDHEWLTNVIIARLYPLLGGIGLAGIYALFAFSALLLALERSSASKIPPETEKKLKMGTWLLSAAAIFFFQGLRPQIISWFFISLLLLILFKKKYQKFLFAVPLLLFLWANLHGSFAIGIFFLAFYCLMKSISEKRFALKEFIILSFCFLVTLVNPYQTRLWGEVWQQFSDSSLRWTIIEWGPGILHFNFAFWFLVAIISVFLFRYWQKYSQIEKCFLLLLLALALTTVRHTPFFVIFVLPMIFEGFIIFYQEIQKILFAQQRFDRFSSYYFYLGLIVFLLSVLTSLPGVILMRENSFYPTEAVKYLKKYSPVKRIFSKYVWGGYLIWKLPEQKVFIDGRMPSWRWGKKISGESNYVMKEYLDLLSEENFYEEISHKEISYKEISYKEIFGKYQIGTVLWSAPQPESYFNHLVGRLEKWLFPQKTNFNFLSQLESDGWQLVYRDKVAVIYQKSK